MALVTCMLCESEEFEEGYGARRRVKGLPVPVGDRCAVPQTRRDVQSTLDYVEGLERSNPDIDWTQILEKSKRSKRRLEAWEARFPTAPDRAKGFLRLCDQDSSSIKRNARKHLIAVRLREAESLLEKVGQVIVPVDTQNPRVIAQLKRRQGRLNRNREKIDLAITVIKENMSKIETRGLLGGIAFWNTLEDTVAAAISLHWTVLAYSQGKEEVDEHRVAQLTRLATQSPVTEGEEASGKSGTKKVDQPTAKPTPPSRVIKGTKTKKSKERAMAFFKEHGGFPDFSWDEPELKSVKLSGADGVEDANREAIAARVNGKLAKEQEEKTTA